MHIAVMTKVSINRGTVPHEKITIEERRVAAATTAITITTTITHIMDHGTGHKDTTEPAVKEGVREPAYRIRRASTE